MYKLQSLTKEFGNNQLHATGILELTFGTNCNHILKHIKIKLVVYAQTLEEIKKTQWYANIDF